MPNRMIRGDVPFRAGDAHGDEWGRDPYAAWTWSDRHPIISSIGFFLAFIVVVTALRFLL